MYQREQDVRRPAQCRSGRTGTRSRSWRRCAPQAGRRPGRQGRRQPDQGDGTRSPPRSRTAAPAQPPRGPCCLSCCAGLRCASEVVGLLSSSRSSRPAWPRPRENGRGGAVGRRFLISFPWTLCHREPKVSLHPYTYRTDVIKRPLPWWTCPIAAPFDDQYEQLTTHVLEPVRSRTGPARFAAPLDQYEQLARQYVREPRERAATCVMGCQAGGMHPIWLYNNARLEAGHAVVHWRRIDLCYHWSFGAFVCREGKGRSTPVQVHCAVSAGAEARCGQARQARRSRPSDSPGRCSACERGRTGSAWRRQGRRGRTLRGWRTRS